MKRICNLCRIYLIVAVLTIAFVPCSLAAVLTSGAPYNTDLNRKSFSNFEIAVPTGAVKLTVSISNGTGDLDLYLKYGSPVSGTTVAELDTNADIRADGPGANETIVLTPSGHPALKAGTWYVAPLNLNGTTTTFTLKATIEKALNPISFGSIVVGQTSQKLLTITNNGTNNLLLIPTYIVGSAASMFKVEHCCAIVFPGDDCEIKLFFSPTSTGVKSAQLILNPNDTNSPVYIIQLTGTGTGTVTGNTLPLPTGKRNFPAYTATITPQSGIDPAKCNPIGVGDVANGGNTVNISVKLENPSGPYDAYLALNAPAIDPDEYFMLGADGSFHPFSQSGLVKWKKSATGKIDVKPFGSFPVSQLPGGDYNFKFILTPANSNDKYYLWQTSFSAPEAVIDVPDGSAGFFNGTLVVPNATIVYQGQEYEGSAPVPDGAIVGISKNGHTYLYHPAMGVAELSDYNSRRAVGFFMLGVSASRAESMRTQQPQSDDFTKPSETLRSASPTETKVIGVGQTVQLGTGVDIKLLDNSGTVEATNKARRFSVVKTSENYLNKYYLPPRSNVLPSEIVTVSEDVYKLVTGQIGIQSRYVKRSDIEASAKVETFGAFIRALPVYAKFGSWSENQKKALQEDRALTIDINAVDFLYCLLDMGKSLGGLFPSDCADLLVSSGLFKGLQAGMALALDDPVLISQIGNDSLKSILSDFIGCLFSLATVHSAECINTSLDILSAFNWVVEDVAWRNFLAYLGTDYDAYDLAILGTKNMLAYNAATPGNWPGKLVMRNLEDGSSWDINLMDNTVILPEIVGITDDGTVVIFINNGWGADLEDQLIAVPDWGRGRAFDLLPVPKGELRKIDIHDAELVDVTGSGLVVFEGRWYDDEARYHNGICKIWINGERLPEHVYFDTHPDDNLGESRLDPNALSISRDGQKLVFSERNNVYSSHHTGARWHLITSFGAPSYKQAEYVNVSDSGGVALFSYPTAWGQDETNVLYSASLHSYETTNLTVATGLTTLVECAKASPDGNWVATIALDPSQPEGSIQQKRIVLIRPGDGYYRWLDTGNICCTSPKHLCFTADSKSVIFSGFDYTALTRISSRGDIFAVDIDELHPNLRNLTNTPDIGEIVPVLR